MFLWRASYGALALSMLHLCLISPMLGVASVSIESYGAIGDGVTDNTVALNAAFSKAAPGSALEIPAGRTYVHNDLVHIVVPGLHIYGGGRLLATNEGRSGVWIEADRVVLEDVILEMKSTTRRWVEYESMKLRLMNARGIVVRNVTIEGAAAAGIYVGNTHDFLMDRVIVRNTRADAIHHTEGSSYGTILRPQIFNPGDDGVAFVSYREDGVAVNNMVLQSPVFRFSTNGRAFSAVGARDIVMNDLYAEDSDAAALYIGAEPSFDTFGVSNVKVNGGVFVRSNQDQQIDHGSILIYNGQPNQVIENITINNVRVMNTKRTHSWEVGIVTAGSKDGSVRRIKIRDLTITGGPPTPLYSQAPSSAYTMQLWVKDGVAIPDRIGYALDPITPPPSPSKTTSPPTPALCFSGNTVVQEKRKGSIRMSELQVGDQILDQHGNYDKVYSFAHRDASLEGHFLQFLPSRLELSKHHLVFVANKGKVIPASMVRVGDILSHGQQVTAIRRVHRVGVYAPFTMSGTIQVNGVVASTYVSLQEDSDVVQVGGFSTGLSWHWVAHLSQSPYRIVCGLWNWHCSCGTEPHSGISMWVAGPLRASQWWIEQKTIVMILVLVPVLTIVAVAGLVEFIITSVTQHSLLALLVTACVATSGWQLVSRWSYPTKLN